MVVFGILLYTLDIVDGVQIPVCSFANLVL